MSPDLHVLAKKTKGERTAQRILDVAEALFAAQATTAPACARSPSEPASGSRACTTTLPANRPCTKRLFRALNPMAQALSQHMETASSLREYTDLPAIITDLLLEHPQMAALFQRAMQGDSTSVGNQLVYDWLESYSTRA